jgi:hypothetical protein
VADASGVTPVGRRGESGLPELANGVSADGGLEKPEEDRAGVVAAHRVVAIAAVVGAAGLLVGIGVRRRLVVADVRWSESPDLARLLRGALERPEAFGETPGLFARPVVPVIGGAVDLETARSLAQRGRLGTTTGPSGLAERVARSGRPVIDGRSDAGSEVASVLAAVDLDRWDNLLTGSGRHPIADRLETALDALGVPCRVLTAAGGGDDVAVIDGWLAGLGGRPVAAVDAGSELWRRVVELEADQPRAAVFVLGEAVLSRLRVARHRRRKALRRLAADCLVEHGEAGQ